MRASHTVIVVRHFGGGPRRRTTREALASRTLGRPVVSSTEDLVVSIVQAEWVILGGMIATVPSCMSEDNMTLDTVPIALSSRRDFLPVDMCGELVVVGRWVYLLLHAL